MGIAVDGDGNVYVSDEGNAAVTKFTASGAYVLQWRSYNSGNGSLYAPTELAVDSTGHVFVFDQAVEAIKVFDTSGNYLTQFGVAATDQDSLVPF